MTISIEDLRRLVSNCDPQVPLTENDQRYVPLDEGVRGVDASCRESLQHRILLAEPRESTCQLFTGFPGAGKTTELHRLKRSLENHVESLSHVVLFDALAYLDQYTPLSITDVLRILAYHLDREAMRLESRDPDREPSYLAKLWRWFQSDVEIKQVGFDAYGTKLMFEIRDNPTFRQKTEDLLQLRFQEFATEAKSVVSEAIERIRRATGVERVVVIVDGLEKLTPLKPEERMRVEESAEAVFSSHAQHLELPCHVIYTFPLWLRFRTAGLAGLYDAPPLTLPMVKVHERGGAVYEPGTEQLATLVSRRIEDMAAVFGPDWKKSILPLIAASGGYPKDLLRLVRDVIARPGQKFPVTSERIQRVIDLLAEEYRMVAALADLDVLAEIARTHSLPQGAMKLQATAWLFDRSQVLTYRDIDEWYDLHPMVRRAASVTEHLGRNRVGNAS